MKKKSKYLCGLFLVATLGLTPFLGAAADELPTFDLDQVIVTATRTPVKLSESGANVSVITKEEIGRMHYRDVEDALRNVPGVQVTDYGGAGGRVTRVLINGSTDIVVLIDGRRMNLPNQMAGSSPIDFSNLIGVDNIERIEVLKGSASALYGADAVGGVVNIITKKGESNSTTLKVVGGSYSRDSYSITNQGQEGSLSWYLTAKKDRVGNFKDGNGNIIADSSNNTKAYNLRLDKKINEKANLSFSYQSYDGDENSPGSLLNPSYANSLKDKENSWDLTYTVTPSDKTNNQIKIYQNTTSYQYLSGSDAGSYYDMWTRGIQYQLTQQANKDHLLTGGLDYYKDELASDFVSPKVEKSNTAFYLQDRWNLNKKLTLDSGLRFDHHETYGSKTTPRITLTYKQDENTNYYLSYNQFFKAPNLFQLYSYKDYGWGFIARGNPNLKSEKGHTVEFGGNHIFDKNLEGSFHYFDRKTEDAIDWYTTDLTTYSGTYININQQKAHGWDMQLNKQFTPEWTAFAGFSYLSVENKKENNEYVKDRSIPEKTWNIGAIYNKEKLIWEIKGKGTENRPGNYNQFPESSYWVWDTALNVRLKSDVNAFIKVNNIFNKYYAENAYAKDNCYPNPGRTYLFGVEYTF